MLEWICKRFDELEAGELYQILKLRQDVFVIEQSCIYPDMDNTDLNAWHLSGADERGHIKACLRIIPPPKKEILAPRIGRVVVSPDMRGKKLAYKLMQKGIDHARALFPDMEIRIGAQDHLRGFYGNLGFKRISDVYLEDGIPHIDMVLPGD